MWGTYRALMVHRDARRLVAASVAARVGIGAFSLPLVLTVQQATGSFAVAGVVTGGFSVGVTIAAPLRGRLVDRRGSRRALPAMVTLSAAALVCIAVLASSAPSWVLAALAAVSGAATPPLVASMRLEWQRLLGAGDARLAQAYALESALQTAVFVAGPLLAGARIAVVGARTTLVGAAAVLLAGTLVFARVAGATPSSDRSVTGEPIRRAGVLTLVVATMLADVALGAIDVVVAAFAEGRGRPALAGALIAIWAVGGVVGAMLYGARAWSSAPGSQLVALALAAAALVALLAAPTSFALLAVLLLLAGVPSAAHWAASSLAFDRASGGRAGAEAFAWLSAANGVGSPRGAFWPARPSSHGVQGRRSCSPPAGRCSRRRSSPPDDGPCGPRQRRKPCRSARAALGRRDSTPEIRDSSHVTWR